MPNNFSPDIQFFFQQIKLPQTTSHKGQNGKLLIIGGSELFHAASKWSLDIASQFVDMVFYSSIPSNNQLVQEAKKNFWNGIVIPRKELENYLQEADCILIGPGMERQSTPNLNDQDYRLDPDSGNAAINTDLTQEKKLTDTIWLADTEKITNYLLKKYPTKKWVIDAGALQMLNPRLLNQNCLLTPHVKELATLIINLHKNQTSQLENNQLEEIPIHFHQELSTYSDQFSQRNPQPEQKNITIQDQAALVQLIKLTNSTILLKGPTDYIAFKNGFEQINPPANSEQQSSTQSGIEIIPVSGGNAGMTKGGTGDVLAGLTASLYCQHNIVTSAVIASWINKKTGDQLYQKVGPYFNASDLAKAIPEMMWQEINHHQSHN